VGLPPDLSRGSRKLKRNEIRLVGEPAAIADFATAFAVTIS
jgi:hypothetical protein